MIKKVLHISMVFALIFSMFSGVLPTDSASAASYVSGMSSAGSTDIATMAKKGINTWSATIRTHDSKTGAQIGTPIVVDKPAIGSHKVNAPTIAGYKLFGAKTQSVRISTFTPSPKITFKYSKIVGSYVVRHTDMKGAEFSRKTHTNVPLGTYTANAAPKAGYEVDGAATQTVTLTEAKQTATVTFKYKKVTEKPKVTPKYSVIYETEDGAEFKRKNVDTGLALNQAYTESAQTFAGYELVGAATQTVTLTDASPSKTITFTYKVKGAVSELKGSYTVSYKDTNGAEFSRDTKRDIAFGEYTVSAKEIAKYKLVDVNDTVTFNLTEDNPSQTVTFTYEPITSTIDRTGYYTVIYETETGMQLSRKTLRSLPYGLYVEEAREFKGYELTSAPELSLELTKEQFTGTLTFKYKPILAEAKTEGTYSVIYENENGAEFSRKTVKALYGTYYESAKAIPNHTLISDSTQNVTISAKNPTATLRFMYKPNHVDVEETSSYTVVYKNEKGAEFSRKTVRNVDFGTYTESAKSIPHFKLVGAEEQKVTVSESNRNPSITFTYTPITTEKEVKGAYTVVYTTEDGAEFSRKSVKDVAFGTYYETAKTIANYEIVGSPSKSITVNNANPTGVITFSYTPVVKEVAPKTSYTVVYKDAQGAEFSRKVVKGIEFGTYTESAKSIPYYTLVGAENQKVTVSATNLNPVITFSYKVTKTEKEVKGAYTVVYTTADGAEFSRKTVKDLAFGNYYESAKQIPNYEVVGSSTKAVKVSATAPTTAIYFTYKPIVKEVVKENSYTVIYTNEKGAEFSRKTVKNVDFGTYTESAKAIPYYTVVGGETKTVTVSEKATNPTITFSYKANKAPAKPVKGEYTIIYTSADGAEFSRKTVKDLPFGSYYESAKQIPNYEVVGSATQEVKVSATKPSTAIYFTYKPIVKEAVKENSYTVIYKNEKGAEFSRKTVKGVDFGTYTESAKAIPYYTVVGGETKTVTVSENAKTPTISFTYEAIKAPAKPVKGEYTIIYTTADGAEFSRKTVKDLPFGSYYESAKQIPNYEVVGSATKEIIVDATKPTEVVHFEYQPKPKAVEDTLYSYTVVYKDANGAEFKRKTVKDVPYGTYYEDAVELPNYVIVGSPTKTITLSPTNENPTVTFEYKAEVTGKEVKGSYTVVYENADGAEFNRKTVTDVDFGDYTEKAKTIPNYTLVGASSKVVTVSPNKPSTVIFFQYKPTPKVVEQATYSYTVVYKDAKGAEFSRKTVKDIPYGTYYETAKEIPHFKIVGSPTKTITLSPTSKKPTVTFEYKAVVTGKEAKGTYTVVYENADGAEFSRKTVKNVAFGKYSETAKEIPNYTLVGSKTKSITVSKGAPSATVYFVYESKKPAVEEKTYSYTVIYKNEKGAEFSRKTVDGVTLGTYTETAKEIPYFDVVGGNEKTITISPTKPVEPITFTYSAKPVDANETTGEYTVVYENPDGAEFSRKTVKDLAFGTYTETAKSIPNYKIKGSKTQKVVVSKSAPKTVVYFTYEPQKPVTPEKSASYTVIYKDANGAEFNRKTVSGLAFGKYTEKAKEIPHYTVKGSASQTVTVAEGKPTATITFTYTQNKVTNAKKGNYTVVYENTDGAEFNRKTVKNIDFGNYTEVAKTIPNFTLVGERIKDVKVTKTSPTATIYFTYAPKASAETAKTKGSYTVIYETVNGAEFNRTNVKDKPFGTYYVTAKEMKGYELVGAKTKTVIVSANQPTTVIYFTYKTKTTDVDKLGSYTIIHTDGNGAEIGREVVKDVEFGEYTVSAKEITGYELQGKPTQSFAVLPEEKTPTITFTYKYKGKETGNEGSYTVRYVDKATGSILGEMKYSNLRLATYTERAAKFLGYTLASKEYQSVGLTKAKPSNTIVFDYVPNANLCLLDFTDSVEFTGSKTSSKAYSKGVHFSVDPSHFTANKQYRVTVKSEDGIYNVKIYAKANNKWTEIGTTKGLMDVTLYSDCFDDKVFLKLSTKLETSSVPHVNNKTAISLKLSRSEQLVYKHNINPFIDITGDAVVQNFRMREIVYGTTYTSFNPNGYFSRAHMFAVISRGLGLSQNGTAKFKDLKKNVWYYDNVMRLNYVGIVLGDNGNAKPNGYTTANQLHLMLDRTSKLYGGKGVDYNTHFKGYKKNDKIKRVDAVRIVSDVFVELNIINE